MTMIILLGLVPLLSLALLYRSNLGRPDTGSLLQGVRNLDGAGSKSQQLEHGKNYNVILGALGFLVWGIYLSRKSLRDLGDNCQRGERDGWDCTGACIENLGRLAVTQIPAIGWSHLMKAI